MNKDILVVDANIAIKWAVMEEDSHIAEKLLAEWHFYHKKMIVPILFVYEITNILLKKQRKNILTLTKAQQAVALILDTGIETYWPIDPELSQKALEFADIYKLPATYDAHYLALAEREGCEFWTADERLYNSVKGQLSWVRLMADPAAASLSA